MGDDGKWGRTAPGCVENKTLNKMLRELGFLYLVYIYLWLIFLPVLRDLQIPQSPADHRFTEQCSLLCKATTKARQPTFPATLLSFSPIALIFLFGKINQDTLFLSNLLTSEHNS